MGQRITPLLIGAVFFTGLLIYLLIPEAEQTRPRFSMETPVRLHEVTFGEFPVVVEALGTASANESIVITALETETVANIHFDDGNTVKKDQLLVALHNREEQARVIELEVNLKDAQRQLKRYVNLARENATSQQLLDEQQARVNALEAQLEVAQTQLEELEIRAPFAGQLGIRQVSVGSLVRPGDEITTLDDLHQIKLDFSIAERHLPSVSLDQTVEAHSVAYPGEAFTGKIGSIGSRVDPITRAIQVRALIANPDFKLRPGMLLQISVQKDLLNSLVIPEQALIPIEDKQFVFVVEDNTAILTEVQIGLRKPGLVQINDGLSEHQQIVVEGTMRLRDGSKVKPLGKTPEDSSSKES